MTNLEILLSEKKITLVDYAEFLGVCTKTARRKLSGEAEFSYPEARKTNRLLFPEYNLEYLFSDYVDAAESA